MSENQIEKELCRLVQLSLQNRQHKESVEFALPQKTIKIVWKKVRIDLRDYYCSVHSDEIRHIQKEHPDDINHICKVQYYLQKMTKVEKTWSYNRNTRKNEPALTFRKYTQKGILSIVEMHISRSKILSLKTLYEDV